MPRITSYTASTAVYGKPQLTDAEVFAVDGTNGVRKITAKEMGTSLFDKFNSNAEAIGLGYNKSDLWRGAYLGGGDTFAEASTPAQRAAIANGTFTGLFVGDCWRVNGTLYRIADFNYWKNSGDTAPLLDNHVLLVPDAGQGSGPMKSDATAGCAYGNSFMNLDPSSALNVARNRIANEFGSYLVSHRIPFANAAEHGHEIAYAWFTSSVDLMSEIMVYGCRHVGRWDAYTKPLTIDKKQLAMFRLNPIMINQGHYHYWLRDLAGTDVFSLAQNTGLVSGSGAQYSRNVRPVFAVKGTTN